MMKGKRQRASLLEVGELLFCSKMTSHKEGKNGKWVNEIHFSWFLHFYGCQMLWYGTQKKFHINVWFLKESNHYECWGIEMTTLVTTLLVPPKTHFAYNGGCSFKWIVHLLFSMCCKKSKKENSFTIFSFHKHEVPQYATEIQQQRAEILGGPGLWGLWAGIRGKPEPSLTLQKSVFRKCPSWHSLLLPSSAESKVLMLLKWSGHFCGCCKYTGLGEEGLKQLLSFKKEAKKHGRDVSTLIPVPELYQQQESSL